MMRTFIILGMLLLAGDFARAEADESCFFISDCPAGTKCVTKEGARKGTCEAVTEEETKNSAEATSISSMMVCAYTSDCPADQSCIRTVGSKKGICQENRFLNLSSSDLSPYQIECTFNTDCEIGSVCNKTPGMTKGICAKDFMFSTDHSKIRTSVADRYNTERKSCLMDVNCGLKESCVHSTRSVYGVCVEKSRILANEVISQ